MVRFRRTARLAAAIVAIGVATVLPQGEAIAQASSHSGGSNYYDGKDPSVSYRRQAACNVNARQIAARPIKEISTGRTVATLQVFYSNSCQTNWIRVTGNPYRGETVKYIESSLGGWNSEVDDGAGASYSMMVYAPGTTRVSGWVYLSTPPVGDWRDFRAEVEYSF